MFCDSNTKFALFYTNSIITKATNNKKKKKFKTIRKNYRSLSIEQMKERKKDGKKDGKQDGKNN